MSSSTFIYKKKIRNKKTISCPYCASAEEGVKGGVKKKNVSVTITETEFWAKVRYDSDAEKYGEGWQSRGIRITDVSCPYYSFRMHISSCTNCSNYIPKHSGFVRSCHYDREITSVRNSDMWAHS